MGDSEFVVKFNFFSVLLVMYIYIYIWVRFCCGFFKLKKWFGDFISEYIIIEIVILRRYLNLYVYYIILIAFNIWI